MTIVLLHGIEGRPGSNWQGWLSSQLTKLGHNSILLELPNPDKPDRTQWLSTLTTAVKDIDPSTLILIGHSLGVATILDYLDSVNSPIKGMISVSGFARDYGLPLNSYFMAERQIDLNKIQSRAENKYVLFGDDDPYVPQADLIHLAQNLNISPMVFTKGGHLSSRFGFDKFPQLLTLVEDIIESEKVTTLIDKLAFIFIKGNRVLVTKTFGKDRWYIPGGKREIGETDYQTLVREVKEELDVDIIPESVRYFGTFKDQAHGKEIGTIVRMRCYTGNFQGTLKANQEIEEIDYFSFSQKYLSSNVDFLIFDDLKEKGLIS